MAIYMLFKANDLGRRPKAGALILAAPPMTRSGASMRPPALQQRMAASCAGGRRRGRTGSDFRAFARY